MRWMDDGIGTDYAAAIIAARNQHGVLTARLIDTLADPFASCVKTPWHPQWCWDVIWFHSYSHLFVLFFVLLSSVSVFISLLLSMALCG